MHEYNAALAFDAINRLTLSCLPSPLESCQRIVEIEPNLPELFIKRDDHLGPLVGGNKLRKLEYVFADALRQRAKTVITCGGIQSNHARITAQTASRLGFKCILVLNGEPPDQPRANLLIDRLLGTEIHYVKTREERDPLVNQIVKKHEEKGENLYKIPLGASNEIGALGLVNAMKELALFQQKNNIEFDYLLVSTSSGGTQAGMILGKALFGLEKLKIIGISADNRAEQICDAGLKAAIPIAERIGLKLAISAKDFVIDEGHIGEGYGVPSEASTEAEKLFARHEGILLDRFYTSKTASALLDYSRKGIFKKSDKVLFWHTGGLITLFTE